MLENIYDGLPPVPVWDDEGSTIDMEPVDSIVAYVLDHHGVEIDWSTNDTAEQVGNQIGGGEAVEQEEIFSLLRTVAHVALNDLLEQLPPRETAEQITQRVLALESLGTWEERIKAAVYLARGEQYRVTESPTQIAERVLDNHRIRPDWRRTGEQIIPLLAEAVRIARGEES
ncbi:hypothetical protein SEA_MASHLEY_99 [Microbacterium phage Mashley]|nr:hypothetical protein SEA_MASHLEY_99 [Microbacterium phage Mashley]